MSRRLAELQVAVMLLSRLPAGRVGDDAPGMGRTAWAWPLVGALIGSITAGAYAACHALGLPAALAALVALSAGIFATGALHEDGLADLADGCGGGHDRARKLEIMRDSRIGSYGVLALILSVALRAGAMSTLADPAQVALAAVGLAIVTRGWLPMWLYLLPPARDDGLGRGAAQVTKAAMGVALALGLAGLVLAGPGAGLATLAGGAVVAGIAQRQLGGQTGDVLGAIQQVSEITGWLVLVALWA
ncbi:adenosylcobinamide-GDP ribazoletransferase [Actibacterium ureilyticum]|uniref:adenosylcobinamide-GDP ribazoletransferase n=1 Tax=Actibacterium ureilyticum TaxID=1590614 RepID=UPI000BAAB0C9|nr:adenosylcobinamide-GDP ribazoletransferase [Actibacterium ureilyticum]